ncbi:hypothetical protein KCP78_25695 [Salmonella enterica subsp. enterica]|nr:hypothetical protein KCP78_25695 [Salmonella enterica subsp. enterica]
MISSTTDVKMYLPVDAPAPRFLYHSGVQQITTPAVGSVAVCGEYAGWR